MILYRMLPDGAFVVGDIGTRRTSFVYPASGQAVRARHDAAEVAAEMASASNPKVIPDHVRIAYDAANWRRLAGGAPAELKSIEDAPGR